MSRVLRTIVHVDRGEQTLEDEPQVRRQRERAEGAVAVDPAAAPRGSPGAGSAADRCLGQLQAWSGRTVASRIPETRYDAASTRIASRCADQLDQRTGQHRSTASARPRSSAPAARTPRSAAAAGTSDGGNDWCAASYTRENVPKTRTTAISSGRLRTSSTAASGISRARTARARSAPISSGWRRCRSTYHADDQAEQQIRQPSGRRGGSRARCSDALQGEATANDLQGERR